jgi:hypothetical protein
MPKKGETRVYEARVVGHHDACRPAAVAQVLLDIDGIDQISDEMPAVSKSYGRT